MHANLALMVALDHAARLHAEAEREELGRAARGAAPARERGLVGLCLVRARLSRLPTGPGLEGQRPVRPAT